MSFAPLPVHSLQGGKRQVKVESLGAVKSRGLDTLSERLSPSLPPKSTTRIRIGERLNFLNTIISLRGVGVQVA